MATRTRPGASCRSPAASTASASSKRCPRSSGSTSTGSTTSHSARPPARGGVRLAPFLDAEEHAGRRTPRGRLTGLHVDIEQEHVARALVEGVACVLLHALDDLRTADVPVGGRLVVVGYAARSHTFRPRDRRSRGPAGFRSGDGGSRRDGRAGRVRTGVGGPARSRSDARRRCLGSGAGSHDRARLRSRHVGDPGRAPRPTGSRSASGQVASSIMNTVAASRSRRLWCQRKPPSSAARIVSLSREIRRCT